MKQKRTFIAILLVLLLLCLGIAYAVVSGVSLNITGQVSATATDANVNVKFTDAQKEEGSKGEVTAQVTNDTEATFTIEGLTTEGDTATMIYTITNDSTDIAATLTKNDPTWTNKDWYNVTYELSSVSLGKSGEGSNTATAKVTVELLKTPVTEEDEAAATDSTISISIDAEPVANS